MTTDITRASPFRVSTFLSLAPVTPTQDFGTMSRHDGDPVPHEHQFYHTVLKGLMSLDLHACGTFSYRNRTGFRNLDDVRKDIAIQRNLEPRESEQSYRLPHQSRAERIAALFEGLSALSGGAKQTIHYTDVSPAVVLLMVTRGGNNPLHYVIGPSDRGTPVVREDAVREMLRVWGDQILSPLYIGWTSGFFDAERDSLVALLQDGSPAPHGFVSGHPREILQRVAADLSSPEHAAWMD